MGTVPVVSAGKYRALTPFQLTLYTSTGACFMGSLVVLVFILRRFLLPTSSFPMILTCLD